MNEERDRFIEYLARLVGDSLISESQAVGFLEDYDAGEIDQLDLPVAPGDIEDDPDWEVVALLLLLLLKGQPFPASTTRAFAKTVDMLQDEFEDKVVNLARKYASRTIPVSVWQEEMYDAVQTHTAQQTMLGGGSTAVTPAQKQRFDDIMDEEEAFLSRFADRIAAGPLTGKQLSEAQIAARSSQYSGTGRGEAFRASEAMDSLIGWVADYITREDKYICGSCIVAGLMSPYLPLDGPYPGTVCQGRSRCRCTRKMRYDPITYDQLLIARTAAPTAERIAERTAELKGIDSRLRTIKVKGLQSQAPTSKAAVKDGEQPLSVSTVKPSKKGAFDPANPADVRKRIDEINSQYGPRIAELTQANDKLFMEFAQADSRVFSAKKAADRAVGTPDYAAAVAALDKHKADLADTSRRMNAIQAERDQLKAESKAKIMPLINAANPANVRIDAKNADPADVRQWQSGVDVFNRLVDAKAFYGDGVVKFDRFDGRANYAFESKTLLVGASTRPAIVAHELGHWLEDISPTARKKTIEFFNRRTEGESRSQLPGQPAGEIGKKDNFLDTYMGREYVTPAGKRYGSEIISMGIQYMQDDPMMFARRDPDYFDFMFNLLRGK